MPKALVFVPTQNTPGKKDATGAFIPEARAFCRELSLPEDSIQFFNNDPLRTFAMRRHDCESAFKTSGGQINIVGFFCHGWKDGIQAGWRKGDINNLAQLLVAHCNSKPVVFLYACDAGRDGDNEREDDVRPGPGGEGGFADMLRDECRRLGLAATIYAHATEGHATQNPWVRVFLPDEMAGGHWVIEPNSPLWFLWKQALRTTSLRWRFGFMPKADIEMELYDLHDAP